MLCVWGCCAFSSRVLSQNPSQSLWLCVLGLLCLLLPRLIPAGPMPCHAMPCHAMPCHAMPCHAMPCHAMPCHASRSRVPGLSLWVPAGSRCSPPPASSPRTSPRSCRSGAAASGAGRARPRSSLMAGGAKRGITNPWLLEESEETRGLGFDELRQQQRRIIEEQDAGLDALSSIISRQKQMGQEIGNELDEQNEIIDDLTSLVESTDGRLRSQTRHVQAVERKSTSCDPNLPVGPRCHPWQWTHKTFPAGWHLGNTSGASRALPAAAPHSQRVPRMLPSAPCQAGARCPCCGRIPVRQSRERRSQRITAINLSLGTRRCK
uniref:Syntaxin-8 n=1 Tax=Junco hyemalis TaxID=40217 RepID=A0A8C5IFK4_JUNHY